MEAPDTRWLSVRVRDNLLEGCGPSSQTVEILDGDELVGQLCAVTSATFEMKPLEIGKLVIVLDAKCDIEGYNPLRKP